MTPRWKKQANLDVEFQIFIHLVDVGENVAHDARNDALKVVIVQDTLKKDTRKINGYSFEQLKHI